MKTRKNETSSSLVRRKNLGPSQSNPSGQKDSAQAFRNSMARKQPENSGYCIGIQVI